MSVRILNGDCRDVLRSLPDESVHCVVTSPPYWGLRDYGNASSIWGGVEGCEHEWGPAVRTAWANSVPGPSPNRPKNGKAYSCDTKWTGPFCQRCAAWHGTFGLEPTYHLYIDHAVEIFREVRRVLRSDGALWLNLGDTYAGSWGAQSRGAAPSDKSTLQGNGHTGGGPKLKSLSAIQIAAHPKGSETGSLKRTPGLKPKDLIGIPWRVAFALQADGWWLRQDIIWHKPNPMPESVRDRCTKAHEYLFLLTKSERYYFDADAIAEQAASPEGPGNKHHKCTDAYNAGDGRHRTKANLLEIGPRDVRNKRSVWTVGTEPFSEAHFATFPPALIEPCILAGCPAGGMILDPFGGAGTTGLVADRLQRSAILIELNPEYCAMAERRIYRDAPLFHEAAE